MNNIFHSKIPLISEDLISEMWEKETKIPKPHYHLKMGITLTKVLHRNDSWTHKIMKNGSPLYTAVSDTLPASTYRGELRGGMIRWRRKSLYGLQIKHEKLCFWRKKTIFPICIHVIYSLCICMYICMYYIYLFFISIYHNSLSFSLSLHPSFRNHLVNSMSRDGRDPMHVGIQLGKFPLH